MTEQELTALATIWAWAQPPVVGPDTIAAVHLAQGYLTLLAERDSYRHAFQSNMKTAMELEAIYMIVLAERDALKEHSKELINALKGLRALIIGECGAALYECIDGERADEAVARASHDR